MADSAEAQAPILAAGGIVVRAGSRPRVAIVRLRRDKAWVLPKGKLNRGERAVVAAKREVLEETGHEVSTHEFLGSMSYPVDHRIKIVQFWHTARYGGPVRDLHRDVKAVKWLPLKEAIDTLSRPHEKVFLANVGPVVVKAAKQSLRDKIAKSSRRTILPSGRFAARAGVVPAVHLISSDHANTRSAIRSSRRLAAGSNAS